MGGFLVKDGKIAPSLPPPFFYYYYFDNIVPKKTIFIIFFTSCHSFSLCSYSCSCGFLASGAHLGRCYFD